MYTKFDVFISTDKITYLGGHKYRILNITPILICINRHTGDIFQQTSSSTF